MGVKICLWVVKYYEGADPFLDNSLHTDFRFFGYNVLVERT
jgi:hypothetical protein